MPLSKDVLIDPRLGVYLNEVLHHIRRLEQLIKDLPETPARYTMKNGVAKVRYTKRDQLLKTLREFKRMYAMAVGSRDWLKE
jgi:hypothetical protein